MYDFEFVLDPRRLVTRTSAGLIITLQPPSINYHRTRPAPTYRRLDLIACEDTRGSQLLLPRPSLRTNANNELHAAPRGPPTCLLHQENTPGTNQVQRSPYSRRSSRIRTHSFIGANDMKWEKKKKKKKRFRSFGILDHNWPKRSKTIPKGTYMSYGSLLLSSALACVCVCGCASCPPHFIIRDRCHFAGYTGYRLSLSVCGNPAYPRLLA